MTQFPRTRVAECQEPEGLPDDEATLQGVNVPHQLANGFRVDEGRVMLHARGQEDIAR